MAATQDSAHISAATVGKSLRSGQRYGVMTPEATPAPDIGRLEADRARLSAGQPQSGDLSVTPQSKPSFDDKSDAESESDGSRAPTQEQVEMTARVLACGKKEYRKILGLDESYADEIKEREAKDNNFCKIAAMVHPISNNTEDAEEAFMLVLKAGKSVGVDKDRITELKFWDGEEEIEEVRLNKNGNWVPASEYMEVDAASPDFVPSSFHQAEYKAATPYLGKLMADPKDPEAIQMLNDANARMYEQDKKDGLSEEDCGKSAIDVTSFRLIFEMAAKAIEALKKNSADSKARDTFELLNEKLRQVNRDHHYPSEWTMAPPKQTEEAKEKPPTTTAQVGATESKPKFLRTSRKFGYVLDNGKNKKIVVCEATGFGHRLLLAHEGDKGFLIYELVAASTFGIGYGKSYMDQPGAKTLTRGGLKDLKGQSLDAISIAGVASVRRDPSKMPAGGWAKEAETIALAGFGDNPEENSRWYARSILGKAFGQAAIDEELNAYRVEAGQERPLPRTSRAKKAGNRDVEGAEA